MLTFILLLFISGGSPLKVLQIVPGFTNSHVLFNYRLAESLKSLGHSVHLWTQMEMAMLDTGNNRLPDDVTEYRIPIHFTDSLKTDGLKVFQSMMFSSGSAYDLWWTGQEFKDMRVEACEQMLLHDEKENFDLAIAHFHDLCPLAIAHKIGVKRIIWITHGTSIYDFAAVQLGLRTQPASVPHPLSSSGFEQSWWDRVENFLWHMSLLDFVNLPQNLLSDENRFYIGLTGGSGGDLWELSREVSGLLINGERLLDFPRALPLHIAFAGEMGVSKPGKAKQLPSEIEALLALPSEGTILFSLGTVSNTTNMPKQMIDSFLGAFAKLSEYTILWRMEKDIPGARSLSHVHLLRWLPQKDLMKHEKTRLLIAHGGYNSLLETAQAGVPAVLMPLFADQKINAKRAQRFEIARVLDKMSLTPQNVLEAISDVLNDNKYKERAEKLSRMLEDKPSRKRSGALDYALRIALKNRKFFTLNASQALNFFSFYNLDIFTFVLIVVFIVSN